MKLEILQYGSRVLKQPATAVTVFDDKLRELVANMRTTMHATDGVGLAAPQVGESIRMFVMSVPRNTKDRDGVRDEHVIINPKYISKSEEQVVMEEGCLSFPYLYFEVTRPEAVTIEYQDEFGETKQLSAHGYMSRVIQHELDHLDGVLYIERISAFKRSLLRNKLKRLQVA